jgi:microcystin degradation protein MlrC
MRFAIGGFAHETNTFCPGLTDLAAFERSWAELDDLISKNRGVRSELGGMIEAAERLGIDLSPTLDTKTEPSATIARDAYETITGTILHHLQAAMPVDAVVLAIHGAGTAEGIDDIEGDFLSRVRALVGPDVPIVATLDLHGNNTQQMVDAADILLYCHEFPHIDMYERGQEAVELAAKIVKREIRPTVHFKSLPIGFMGATTFEGPAKMMKERCYEWEAKAGVIDCTFVHGFLCTDLPIISTSILVTTDDDPDLAAAAAKDIAGTFIENLESFYQQLPGVNEAIEQALAATALPVVISEVSDNPGGGARGDGTHLLRALLNANVPKSAFGFIWDPETASQAHAAGVGARIEVKLGGFSSDLQGGPIEAEAYVQSLSDGRFTLTTPMRSGSIVNLGPSARLVIGNVDVIVGSMRTQTLDPGPFLAHGIDVTTYRIVALKSTQHFRGGFQHLAGAIIRADGPGLTCNDFTKLPYTRIKRPFFPLDPIPFEEFLN